jgi:type VI protein secretion system component VasF
LPGRSEEDVDRLVAELERVRDDVRARAERLRAEVERRLESARRHALEGAEETRKVAASAAWWSVGAGVVSGLAAALGGILAVAT